MGDVLVASITVGDPAYSRSLVFTLVSSRLLFSSSSSCFLICFLLLVNLSLGKYLVAFGCLFCFVCVLTVLCLFPISLINNNLITTRVKLYTTLWNSAYVAKEQGKTSAELSDKKKDANGCNGQLKLYILILN